VKIKIVSLIPIRKHQILQKQLVRVYRKSGKSGNVTKDDIIKIIFGLIKSFDRSQFDKYRRKEKLGYIEGLIGMIEELTPREFSQIFPIKKTYSGARYGEKDYFTTTDYIDSIGWDNRIPNGLDFLTDYVNDDVRIIAAELMVTIADYADPDWLSHFFGSTESEGI